jgi:hypothetical protein
MEGEIGCDGGSVNEIVIVNESVGEEEVLVDVEVGDPVVVVVVLAGESGVGSSASGTSAGTLA